MRKVKSFATFAEHIPEANGLQNIRQILARLEELNAIIHGAFPELKFLCHCGAIDEANDLLVIYTVSNASFYKVNQCVPLIQDVLSAQYYSFSRILIKSNPDRHPAKPAVKHQVGRQEYAMLVKFAQAINREDLLKPEAQPESDENVPADWQINL